MLNPSSLWVPLTLTTAAAVGGFVACAAETVSRAPAAWFRCEDPSKPGADSSANQMDAQATAVRVGEGRVG